MEIEIKPVKYLNISFNEILEFKDTLFFLIWKDIKVKYKQTILGFLWVILQPLLMLLVFVLLQKAIIIPQAGSNVSYPLFVLSGILFWNLFSSSVIQSSNSVVSNAHIIKKIYFPRFFFPLSSIFVALFDFFIAIIIYIPLMFYYKQYPSINILWTFPLAFILIILVAMGIGSFFSALNVKYRDVKYIIPFLIQLLFFISPVFYFHNFITNNIMKIFYYINPLSGILELVRYGFFNIKMFQTGVAISILSTILFFLIGIFYFRKVESTFADLA